MRPLKYVAIYLLLVCGAWVVAKGGKFAGVYLVVLTMPWSGLGVLISDFIDPHILDNESIGNAIVAAGATVNAVILYAVIALLGSWHKRNRSGSGNDA